jgi:hypothetical protein
MICIQRRYFECTNLQVSVENICRMYILETSQNLIHKVLDMINSKRLFTINDSVQICFHKVLHNVNIFKLFRSWRRWNDVNDSNYLKTNQQKSSA